ncbi:MAG: hypothetical protein AB7S44_03020 [Spirochaetales bacterium]
MDLGFNEIMLIILGVCALFYLLMWIRLRVHKKNEKIKKTGIKEEGGVRYTVEEAPVVKIDAETKEEEPNMTLNREDVVLKRGFKYVVGAKNKVIPGKYTVLSTEESIPEFNIRRNGYVRSYEHNSSLVLVEGDELTPINIPVILR